MRTIASTTTRMILVLCLACTMVLVSSGCAASTQKVDVCGTSVELPKDQESEVVVETANATSKLNDYEFPPAFTTLSGNPDVIAEKARSFEEKNRENFDNVTFTVLSVNGKQLEQHDEEQG